MRNSLDMLLVEPATLLRRTVALTARSMGMANVHEAASHESALRLLMTQAFDGALIAIDDLDADAGANVFALLDQVRAGATASRATIPIAVMMAHVDASMLAALRARRVTRVLVKPFKARNLIDTFSAFATEQSATAPAVPYRTDENEAADAA